MSDMRHYARHSDLPDYGFSPDGQYPLINIEKGGLNLLLTAEAGPAADAAIPLYAMTAGERPNVVPGVATAVVGTRVVGLDGLCEKLAFVARAHPGFDLKAEPDGEGRARITATGVSAHASLPHLGVNAAGMLLVALCEIGAGGAGADESGADGSGAVGEAIRGLAERIGLTHDGSGLGMAISDELSGALTSNLGILRYDGASLSAELDNRYPLSADEGALLDGAARAMAPTASRSRRGATARRFCAGGQRGGARPARSLSRGDGPGRLPHRHWRRHLLAHHAPDRRLRHQFSRRSRYLPHARRVHRH